MLPVLVVASLSAFRSDHAVVVNVVSPWRKVPLFDQFLCHFAERSSDQAIRFLLAVLPHKRKLRDDATFLWEEARKIGHNKLLRAEIDVGFYIPRIQMLREIAADHGGSDYANIIVVGKKRPKFDFDFEFHEQTADNNRPFDFDIVVGNEGGPVVYADLYQKETSRAILSLIEKKTNFVLRPTSRAKGNGDSLRGFGIEMRPYKNNMIYNKDHQLFSEFENEPLENVNDVTVQSVNRQAKPYVNVNIIRDFGARFTTWLASKKGKLPTILRDLASNYPLYASEILETSPREGARKEFQMARSKFMPYHYSSLNGRQLSLLSLNIFDLLLHIKRDQNKKDLLEYMGIEPEMAMKLMEQLKPIRDEVFLDCGQDDIVFFNDIEKDKTYERWSTNIEDLWRKDVFVFPKVRKNFVTAICVIDPMVPACVDILSQLVFFVEQDFPVRLGVMPCFCLGNRLARKVAFAFFHIAERSPADAVNFLVRAYQRAIADGLPEPEERDWQESYATFVADHDKWSDLHRLYDGSSSEFQKIQRMTQRVKDLGLTRSSFVINGRVFDVTNNSKEMITFDVQHSFVSLVELIRDRKYKSLDEFNIKELVGIDRPMVKAVCSHVGDYSGSLDVTTKSLNAGLRVVKLLDEIEWIQRGSGEPCLFYIIYSTNATDIEAFHKFMERDHIAPSEFAINPPQRLVKESNKTIVVASGRVYEGFDFTQESLYDLIELISNRSRIEDSLPRRAQRILSCMVYDVEDTEKPLKLWKDKVNESHLIYVSDNGADHTWDIIVDPFAPLFHVMADIIRYVDDLGIARVRMAILPPEDGASAVHLMSSYYRSALDSGQATFTMLNDTTPYTLIPHMPGRWLMEPVSADFDLNNVTLQEKEPGIHRATYVLKNLVFDGTCVDENDEIPENVEIGLFNSRSQLVSDTRVMKMSGYWQFKANPGIFTVDLYGDKSTSRYEMRSEPKIIDSFAAQPREIHVKSRGTNVKVAASQPPNENTTVNVFSFASCQSEERMLKVMILSARRHTTGDMKFWLLDQFLSPEFKSILPIMANKYDFTYELISYRWPSWIRRQAEKQKIVRAYKSLLLDVLFPREVKRVICIDPDQLVRCDLRPLAFQDIGRVAYALAPICESGNKSESHRYWKTNSWQEQLNGAKFHSSSLMLVDLPTFRSQSIGDSFRGHYQIPANDRFTQTNLDQDLINFFQHQHRVYSLPEEWFWCETWCSPESMATAKVITVSENLELSEWSELDAEVAALK